MISANVAQDAMRNHEWVQKLPWQYIEILAKLAEERDFEPGEVFFTKGNLRTVST